MSDIAVEVLTRALAQSLKNRTDVVREYKQNVKNLEDEVKNLREQRKNIQEKVNEANLLGEVIDNHVFVWLMKAELARDRVDDFMGRKDRMENTLCCNFTRPDYFSRYRLSKEAKKKVVELKHHTDEGSNIGTISHPKGVPPELQFRSAVDYVGFHSRDEVMGHIMEALKDPAVNKIGVYGTGGIGKTTMVTKVGEVLKNDGTFDEIVMAVVSQDANVTKIQGRLAGCLNLKLSGETEMLERATQLWNRLNNGKKNLILLDDVWQELNFMDIGIPIKDDNKSCKVVLTSRKRDVWNHLGIHKVFRIEILSNEESWDLFKKEVEKFGHTDELLARAVCEECRGLPVTINALGKALKDKGIDAWEDALDKLKNSMLNDVVGIDPKVYTSLKWSYDRLDSEDAKSCFLLCCLYPEDAWIPIEDLVRYCMAGRSNRVPNSLEAALRRVRTAIDTLKSRCLLLDANYSEDEVILDENYSEDFVKMHDVMRDVAISIARCEKSFLIEHGVRYWPQKHSYGRWPVISFMLDDMHELPKQLDCPELQMLRMNCTVNEFQLQVPDGFFSVMENLTVLDLERVTMSPVLPSSLAKLAKLQMLCLDGCELGDIALLKDLKDHLEMLSLRRSNIKVLPPEVGELTRLRLLDMEDCDKLAMISKGVISNLYRLEELYMPFTFGQWEGITAGTRRHASDVSLDELTSLTRLTTLHVFIPDPTVLPKDFNFQNLVRFNISVGKGASYSNHKDSTGVLNLENIHLANTLEGLLGKPTFRRQTNGWRPSESFSHLTKLSVTNCTLKYLFSPSTAEGLFALRSLEIEGCMDMEGVIRKEGEQDGHMMINFNQLNELNLKDLPKLLSFYPERKTTATSSASSSAHAHTVLFTDKVAFPALQKLFINFVPKITEIWFRTDLAVRGEESWSFNHLQSMAIHYCDKLVNVIGGCPTIEVDHHVTRFPKLTILDLKDLMNLESFCSQAIGWEARPLFDHQVAFPTMKELAVSGLPNITDIWEEKLCLTEFCPLRSLKVVNCCRLVNVVQSTMLPLLRNLEELYLYTCPMVGAVVNVEKRAEETPQATNDTIVSFPELGHIQLGRLQNLRGFCNFRSKEQPLIHAQVAFPKLEYLILGTLRVIPLWQLQGACELCLKYLVFTKSHEVSTVVSRRLFQRLRSVDILKVENCTGVTEVFHFDGGEIEEEQECTERLTQIKTIQLNTLPQLTCLWNKNPLGFLCLQNLEYLIIKDCHLLRSLLTASVARALGGLKVLYLMSCSMMDEVIATEAGHEYAIYDREIRFPKLEWLILKDLSNLRSFCKARYSFNFPSLRRVVLKRCPNMETFTSGSVRMPPTLLITQGNDGLVIKDLNKHLQQQNLKGEVTEEVTQEKAMIKLYSPEMDGNEDQFEHLEFLTNL